MAQDIEDGVPFEIKLDPRTLPDINPVKTQHTVAVTVLDRQGRPLANQRVEWILARGPQAVGDIVEHDDMYAIIGSEQKIVKLGNQYTITYTNDRPMTLDMGTTDTRDDLSLDVGQTWITITSPLEGETHVIAFCPGIKDSTKHKDFGVKYWMDAKIIWPEDAVNPVGTTHTFTFQLRKESTDVAMPGYRVKWELLDAGVPGSLGDEPDQKVMEVATNDDGKSEVVLRQMESREGTNTLRIELRSPENKLLATRTVTKTWISPKIIVQKSGPNEGILGEKVVYGIEVSNPGAADANDVVLQDMLPDGLSYVDCTVPPTDIQGKTLTWKLGILPKDASQKFVLTLKADQVGLWTNTAEVTSKEFPKQTSSVETKIGAPSLYIVKEISPSQEIRKDTIATYTITVRNTGNAVAKDVTIKDQVPAGMQLGSRSKGMMLTWNMGNVEPGASKSVSYQLQGIQTGKFINTAMVYIQGKEVHKTSLVTTVVSPDLKLTKDGSSRVIVNKPAEYTITVTNDGDAVAKDMVLTDLLPPELEYLSAEPPHTTFKAARENEPATVTWKLGDIQPKQTPIVVKLKVRANTIARCRNTAKLRSDSPELPAIQPLEAYCDTTIQGVPAMHINTYDTEDPVEVGKQTIYVIETRNEGTSPCTNIVMKSRLDDEMEFVSAQGPTSYRVEGNLIIFDEVPILPPTEKLTYKVVCRAVKEGSAKHAALLSYKQFDKEIISEEGTNVYK